MANKRVISVNESSLVDLKAELYRKETQFKREKVDSSHPKKAPIWQRKKKESRKHVEPTEAEKNPSPDSSYNKQLEKSRLMLEAKSALYEKLSKGEIEVPSDEDEQEGRFLVDFLQKTIPKTNDSSGNEDENNVDQNMPPAASPDEEWVDYVDSFGRSKKCLRKDLQMMKNNDEKSKPNCSQVASIPSLLSDDMRREIVRKKWEEEVEETLDKPVGPVHYQNVLFEETREHGVGYYKFSKAEDERQEQQMTLKKLRAQTEQQRDKREKLLEKRKAAMDARLAKVKERKLRKLKEQGVVVDEDGETAVPSASRHEDTKPEAEDETSSSPKDEDEIAVGDFVERIRNKATRIEKSHLNKWEKNKVDLTIFDKPKPNVPTYDPGSERNPEFAPPSFYTSASNHANKTFAKKTKWKQNTKEENNTMNETPAAWISDTVSDTRTTSPLLAHDVSYPQESPSSSNVPQVPVSSYQPPLVGNVLPNLPLPPTHAFPPPAFLPSFPSPYPPQFPSSSNNFANNIPYPPPPPGVYQYPPVQSQVNYSLSANTTSIETLAPGPQCYHPSAL